MNACYHLPPSSNVSINMAIPQKLKPSLSFSLASFNNSSFTCISYLSTRAPTFSSFFGSNSQTISSLQILSPTFSRRQIFLPAVSGIWDALTGGNSAREAGMAIRRGMLLFKQVLSFQFLSSFLSLPVCWNCGCGIILISFYLSFLGNEGWCSWFIVGVR